MSDYTALFKCRLCGEIFATAKTGNKKIAERAVLFASIGKSSEPQAPTLYDVHNCKNGDIGLSDFLGFKMEKKTNERVD